MNEPQKTRKNAEFLYHDESYLVRGAIFEVYKKLGMLVNFGHSPQVEIARMVRSS